MSDPLSTQATNKSQEQNLVELLKISQKNIPATTSLKISSVFSKNHDDVLKSIRKLIELGEFTGGSFAESEYTDSTGRKNKMYVLNELMTSVLIMGFTGKKAIKWKISYAKEFERLRKTEANKVQRFKGDEFAIGHKLTCQVLEHARKLQNKETKHFHYANHCKLINTLAELPKIETPRKHMDKEKALLLNKTFLKVNKAVLEGNVHKEKITGFIEEKYQLCG